MQSWSCLLALAAKPAPNGAAPPLEGAAVVDLLVTDPLRAAAGRPAQGSRRPGSLHPSIVGQVRSSLVDGVGFI